MAILSGLLDSIFGFTLLWDPIYAIVSISFVLSCLIILLYKIFTDQKEMKRLKTDLKEYQKKMKGLRDQPDKLMAIQKQAMKLNMEYMKKSMKITFITFLPMILILGWLDAHFAYEPLGPGQQFDLVVQAQKDITGSVVLSVPQGLRVVGKSEAEFSGGTAGFKLEGDVGEYLVTLKSNEREIEPSIEITTNRRYAPVEQSFDSEVFKGISLGNNKLKVFWKLSWLWTYILSMLVFSVVLRKVFDVH